jgi:hypothetical protein
MGSMYSDESALHAYFEDADNDGLDEDTAAILDSLYKRLAWELRSNRITKDQAPEKAAASGIDDERVVAVAEALTKIKGLSAGSRRTVAAFAAIAKKAKNLADALAMVKDAGPGTNASLLRSILKDYYAAGDKSAAAWAKRPSIG